MNNDKFGRLDGLTDEQAMGCAYDVSPTSEYSKRCSELREGGFIEPTGETRAGSAGPQRIVSKITDKGRAWIRENR
jgi:DNA-binding PadR family transcriptional regulator